jgi:glutamyl-tRNA(Gln) amidotransferase subunit D
MYSKRLSDLLTVSKTGIGDAIEIVTVDDETYRGILMPKIEGGNPDCIVIKLENGYNIGIHLNNLKKLTIIEKKVEGIEIKKVKETKEAEPKESGFISIIGCGGTIASKVDYRHGGVSPAITPDELVLQFPALQNKNFKTHLLFQILSEDITPEHWKVIAEDVASEIKGGAQGVILLHGTDTMHYTSAALSFMIKTPNPIVLVGAQRSSDRGSSDNLLNFNAALMAVESDIAEIGVCMHGTTNDDWCYLHRGTRVRKMHTSRRDAFKTINGSPLAKISPDSGKITLLSSYRKRGESALEVDTRIDPNVALIQIHPGIKEKFIEKLADYYNGVVLAGTGLGHVPTNVSNDQYGVSLIPAIKSLISSGVPVVIAPQTIFGRVNLNVYAAGREMLKAGVIGNYCDWTPETALVKLMWVLGHTQDMKKIEEMMLTNIAGEISERNQMSTNIVE